MRAAIVDDEPLARRGSCQLVTDYGDVEIVAECANETEALIAVETQTPDLIFLDTQMPEMDGFDLVRRIGAERMPAVVFITAYRRPALPASKISRGARDALAKRGIRASSPFGHSQLQERPGAASRRGSPARRHACEHEPATTRCGQLCAEDLVRELMLAVRVGDTC